MLTRRVLVLLLIAGCASDPIDAPSEQELVFGSAESALRSARVELTNRPTAIAVSPFSDRVVIAGAGFAAAVREDSTPIEVAQGVIMPAEEAIAIAVDASDDAFIVWPSAVLRTQGELLSALPPSMLLEAPIAAVAADVDGEALWLAGARVFRVSDSSLDKVSIDGASGPASALAAGWVAFGEKLFGVSIDGAATVKEITDPKIGTIRALATHDGRVYAGGSAGLLIRDREGVWTRYLGGGFTALAAGGGLLLGVLDGRLVRIEDRELRLVQDESGAPIAGIERLVVSHDGTGIVLRGSELSRYELDHHVKLEGVADGQEITEAITVGIHASRAAELQSVGAHLGDVELLVSANGDTYETTIDPSTLAEGSADLSIRVTWKDASEVTVKVAVTVLNAGPPPSFAADIKPWAENTCSCHMRSTSYAAPKFETAAEWRAGERPARIRDRVVNQLPPVMPPPEQMLRPTAEQREILLRWLRTGMED